MVAVIQCDIIIEVANFLQLQEVCKEDPWQGRTEVLEECGSGLQDT